MADNVMHTPGVFDYKEQAWYRQSPGSGGHHLLDLYCGTSGTFGGVHTNDVNNDYMTASAVQCNET